MSQYTVSFRSGLGLRERVVVVMDSFGRFSAKQGRLTKGNILVFGGEGLSCSGGSWERKAAWGGGQLFLWRQQLVWAGSPAVVLLLLSGGGGQLSRLQHSSLQLIIQSRLLIKTEKP